MTDPNATVESVMAFMEQWSPFRDAVLGYRVGLIAMGVSADDADAMAVDLHRYFMAQLMAAIGT